MNIGRIALNFAIGLLTAFHVTGSWADQPLIVGPIHDEDTVPWWIAERFRFSTATRWTSR
jgi:hypothetical protein